jgi:hypothetical protein
MPDSVRVDWQGGDPLVREIDDWWQRVEARLPTELQRAGTQILAFARLNHPWQNQTGAAEAGLRVEVRQEGDTFVIEISHSVYYGIYLESRWAGRWGVIPATVAMGGPLVMAAAVAAMS